MTHLMVLENNHVVTFSLNVDITYILFVTVKCGYWNNQYCVARLSVFIITHFTYLVWNDLPKYIPRTFRVHFWP